MVSHDELASPGVPFGSDCEVGFCQFTICSHQTSPRVTVSFPEPNGGVVPGSSPTARLLAWPTAPVQAMSSTSGPPEPSRRTTSSAPAPPMSKPAPQSSVLKQPVAYGAMPPVNPVMSSQITTNTPGSTVRTGARGSQVRVFPMM